MGIYSKKQFIQMSDIIKNRYLFLFIISFLIINLYAEENILNRIFFKDFIKSGNILIKNPAVSVLGIAGTALTTAVIMNNDLIIKDYFNNNRTEFFNRVFDFFNLTGDGVYVLAFNSLLFLAGEKEKKTAEKVIEAVAVSGGVSYILKILTGRHRPSDTDDRYMFAPFSFNDSFPSGHTTVAFAWATVFAENYGIWYITYPVAVMCGAARIYKNMHWASDVFVGAMIGTFFGKIICQDNNFNIGMSAGLNDNASIIIIKMSI